MNMKKIYIIILLILITILLIIFGLYLGNMFANKINVDMSKVEIDNTEPTNEVYNPIKTNEISEYIPKNIKEIILTNNISDSTNPTIYKINKKNRMEEFINLFFKTNWDEKDKNQMSSNFDGALYQIEIIGDTKTILNMQGIRRT